MTSSGDFSLTPAATPALLERALEKSQDVKEKMVDCVAELSTVNETVKQELAVGVTLQQAKKALAQSESVEEKVQECADELHEANEVLAQGIGDRDELHRELRETERKLVHYTGYFIRYTGRFGRRARSSGGGNATHITRFCYRHSQPGTIQRPP